MERSTGNVGADINVAIYRGRTALNKTEFFLKGTETNPMKWNKQENYVQLFWRVLHKKMSLLQERIMELASGFEAYKIFSEGKLHY